MRTVGREGPDGAGGGRHRGLGLPEELGRTRPHQNCDRARPPSPRGANQPAPAPGIPASLRPTPGWLEAVPSPRGNCSDLPAYWGHWFCLGHGQVGSLPGTPGPGEQPVGVRVRGCVLAGASASGAVSAHPQPRSSESHSHQTQENQPRTHRTRLSLQRAGPGAACRGRCPTTVRRGRRSGGLCRGHGGPEEAGGKGLGFSQPTWRMTGSSG